MSKLDFSNDNKPLIAFSQAGLTDIVLLLLIFFLLTSSFVTQTGINVTLPQTEAAAPTQGQFVTVAITAGGDFFVEDNEVQAAGLLDAVRQAKGTKTSLVVRGDQNATLGQFAKIANVAKALNLRVLMATEQNSN